MSNQHRSVTVHWESQCIFECQRVVDASLCVGVNFQQPSNVCGIYYTCPTNYTVNVTGCQFFQKWDQTDNNKPICSVACDGNCTSLCVARGPGKCDSQCATGFGITSDFTCKPCSSNFGNGSCNNFGLTTCDGPCWSGFMINPVKHTCFKCPTGYSYRSPGNSCYKFSKSQFGSYAVALTDCNGAGGHLVWIGSQAEQNDILSLVGSSLPTYIGLCRWDNYVHSWKNSDKCQTYYGGVYSTRTEAITFTAWNGDEPDNYGFVSGATSSGEACVAIRPNGRWGDVPCDLPSYYFVCEYDI